MKQELWMDVCMKPVILILAIIGARVAIYPVYKGSYYCKIIFGQLNYKLKSIQIFSYFISMKVQIFEEIVSYSK